MRSLGFVPESSLPWTTPATQATPDCFGAPGNRPSRRDAIRMAGRTRLGRAAEGQATGQRERGVAAVEFAIGAMLLLLIGFGAWEYGLFLQQGQTLASSVRTAARVTATACIPPSDLDNRVATDPECIGGNKASDDFQTLRTLQASLGKEWDNVEQVLVYKVPGSYTARGQGKPPEFCRGNDGSVKSYDGWCNAFTPETTYTYAGSTLPLLKNLDKFFYTASEATAKNDADTAAALAAGKPAPTTLVAEGDPKTDMINQVFDCTGDHAVDSPSAAFCPTKLDTASAKPVRQRGLSAASNLGVYVKLNHNMVTGLFGKQQKIEQWSLFRLEPSPFDNTTYACTGSTCDAPPAVTTGQADLRITKVADQTEVLPGDDLNYTITVTNLGPNAVSGAQIKDPSWPSQLTNLGWTCAGTECESPSGTTLDETVNLPVGAQVTYSWKAKVKTDASGLIENTATVTPPTGVTDPTTSNNSATATTPIVKPDLRITKLDDELSTASPFQDIVFKLWVTNVGAVNVNGSVVGWNAPPQLDVSSWQCVEASGGATCQTANQSGPFSGDTVNMPKGAVIKYEIRGQVRVDAAGTMAAAATVTLPSGFVDETPANNTDVHEDNNPGVWFGNGSIPTVITPPDISISKTDSKSIVGPLEDLSYTVTASNNGVFRVIGAKVVDTPPATLTNVTWTCNPGPSNTCPAASGTGSLNETVTIQPGTTIVYTVNGTVAATATGSIVQTASFQPPTGMVESNTTNNTATDTDAIQLPNLVAAKSDGITSIAPGMATDYTITVTNSGAVKSKNAVITDTPPTGVSGLTGVAWSCTAATGGAVCPSPATGSGALNVTMDVPAAASVTFHVTGTLANTAVAPGTLVNTILASNASGVNDQTPANNTATDTNNIQYPDVSVAKTRTPTGSVSPGSSIVYTVTYANAGPGTATGVAIADPLPTGIASFAWTCAASGTAVCPAASGSGAVSSTVNLPAGGQLVYSVTGVVANSASGSVVNTATATFANDPSTSNNTASVTNTVANPDLGVTLTSSPASGSTVGPASTITYTFTVKNNTGAGTSPAGIGISLPMPSQITSFTWTCAGTACPAPSGTGAINATTTATLAPGATIVYTVTATLAASPATGSFTTTGSLTPPAGVVESGSLPNSASVNHIVAHPDLRIVKTASVANAGPGQTITYYVTTTNLGPGTASSVQVSDNFDSKLGSITWTCGSTGGAACPAPSGSGNISQTVATMPVNATVTYTVTATIADSARTSVVNTATTAYSGSLVDPVTSNNTSSVTVTLQQPDLIVTKTDGQTNVSPNQALTYTITFSNAGPGPANGTSIADTVPTTKLTGLSWSCSAAGGAACPANPTTNLAATVNIPSGGVLTFTLNATVSGTATGTIVQPASITAAVAVGDRDTSNNSATDTDTIVIPDLGVTKTDGQTNVSNGQSLTYTIVATNYGPGPVTNAKLIDTPPASLTSVTWSCGSPTGGATCPTPTTGSGALNITNLNLPANGSVTYTVTGIVSGATGSIIQNVTLNHQTATDPNPGNNTATDTNTIVVADLSITKNDGVTNVAAGQALQYDIVASNAGPGPVVGAKVTDTIPAQLTSATWTCFATSGGASCPTPSSGSGNISSTVNIPAGGSITFRVNATVVSTLTSGSIAQTASVAQPTGYVDPTPTNNSATDTDTIAVSDLSITKTDGQTNVGPGQALTYQIIASNAGPGPVTGAKLVDTPPATLTGVSWNCNTPTGGAACPTPTSGTGSINLTNLSLPANSSLRYTVTGAVSGTAVSGSTITQTATLNHATATDPTPTNNTASDVDTVQLPDPWVTKTSNVASAGRGDTVVYTVTVGNSGPGPAAAVSLTDTMPAQLSNVTWTCAASGSATCPTASGSGSITGQSSATFPSGGQLVYTITSKINATASSGAFTNTASITATADRDSTNNSRGAAVTVTSPDLSITKTNGISGVKPGQSAPYTIVVTNNGPGSVTGAVIADSAPTNFTGAGWTCTAGGTATCPAASGTGTSISQTTGVFPAGGTLTYVWQGIVPANASGTTVNTATVTPPTGQAITEANTANNSATDTDSIIQPDVSVSKTDNTTAVYPLQVVTYDIVVSNLGTTPAANVGVTDNPPTTLINRSWACQGVTGGATCPAPSGTSLSVTIPSMPAGSTVTYRMTATVASGTAAGTTITNTANVAFTGDPITGNNSSTDTDTVTHPDLRITKGNGISTVWPGYQGTYTIIATNLGPGPVTGATVTDTMPTSIGSVSWTCAASASASCPASGTGSISTSAVNLPVNGTATFTVNYTVNNNYAGTIANQATIAVPTGYTDPNTGNNTATDTDTSVQPDVAITKTDGQTSVYPGQALTYSIVVTNNGPGPVNGITVADTLPATLVSGSTTWTCSAVGTGASCPASGSGSINTSAVNLPSGGTATFNLATVVANSATGTLSNTATAAVPAATFTDSNTTNNTATDSEPITLPDVVISKTDGVTSIAAGQSTTYTILVTNNGPGPAGTVTVADTMPAALLNVTWNCTSMAGGATCGTASGNGSINTTAVLPIGGQVRYLVTGTVNSTATGTLVNTATATLSTPADRSTANNTATDTDTITVPVTTTTIATTTTTTKVFGGT